MPPVQGEPPALHCFGRDLTALAHAGQYAPLEGYEPWVSRVLQILMRPPNKHNNPVLIGLSDVEGWPIVAEVVRRIARGEVPAGLRVRRVVALDWEALVRDLPEVGESDSWAAPEHRWHTQEELADDVARWERLLRQLLHDDDRVEGLRAAPIDQPAAPIDAPIDAPIHQRLEAVFANGDSVCTSTGGTARAYCTSLAPRLSSPWPPARADGGV